MTLTGSRYLFFSSSSRHCEQFGTALMWLARWTRVVHLQQAIDTVFYEACWLNFPVWFTLSKSHGPGQMGGTWNPAPIVSVRLECAFSGVDIQIWATAHTLRMDVFKLTQFVFNSSSISEFRNSACYVHFDTIAVSVILTQCTVGIMKDNTMWKGVIFK